MRRIVSVSLIFIGLGLCFRFAHLERHVYWYDETFTSLRSAGYTEAEIVEQFSQSSIVTIAALQTFQQPHPRRQLSDTWHSLAVEDTQHPPLYYSLSYGWMRWVGHSVFAMRLLPAIFSALTFPSIYWLCWELFVGRTRKETNQLQVTWMAVALVAVSPFHLLYAQEARQYSLWTMTTVLATASLLRAIRVNSTVSWSIYAVTLTASFYTFLFTGLMAIAHGLYLFSLATFRLSHTVVAYLVATLLAVVAFLPWLWTVATQVAQIRTVTGWTETTRSWTSLASSWASMLGRLFYDRSDTVVDRLIQSGIIVLIGVAFCHLIRQTPKPIWLLVVMITGVPILALIIPDLLLGGARSTAPRYLIPALLGIELAMAHFLASILCNRRWRWITVAILAGGLVSCLTIHQASTWWIKPHNSDNVAIAQLVNQAVSPLLISDAETADLLSLSYVLPANTPLFIRPRCYTCNQPTTKEINPFILNIPEKYTDIFLFHPRPTKEWRHSIEHLSAYTIQPLPSGGSNPSLWQLKFKAELKRPLLQKRNNTKDN
jgi:uncharacterized membrane protein